MVVQSQYELNTLQLIDISVVQTSLYFQIQTITLLT